MYHLNDGFGAMADLTKPFTVYIPGTQGHCDGIACYFDAPTLENPRRVATRSHLTGIEQAMRIAASHGFKRITVIREGQQ